MSFRPDIPQFNGLHLQPAGQNHTNKPPGLNYLVLRFLAAEVFLEAAAFLVTVAFFAAVGFLEAAAFLEAFCLIGSQLNHFVQINQGWDPSDEQYSPVPSP